MDGKRSRFGLPDVLTVELSTPAHLTRDEKARLVRNESVESRARTLRGQDEAAGDDLRASE